MVRLGDDVFQTPHIFPRSLTQFSLFSSWVFTARKQPDPMPGKVVCITVHKKEALQTASVLKPLTVFPFPLPSFTQKKSRSYETRAKYWAIKLRDIEGTVFLRAYFFQLSLLCPSVFSSLNRLGCPQEQNTGFFHPVGWGIHSTLNLSKFIFQYFPSRCICRYVQDRTGHSQYWPGLGDDSWTNSRS